MATRWRCWIGRDSFRVDRVSVTAATSGWLLLTAAAALFSASTLWPWVRADRTPPPSPVTRSAAAAGASDMEAFAPSMRAAEPAALPDLAAPLAAPLPVSPSWWTDQTLQERIAAAVPRDIGHVAVAIRHLRTGASVLLDADAVMPPASLFKLGVMVEAFRQIESGALALDEALLLTWDDWAEGSGVLQGRIGNAVSVSEALRLMIGLSDNTAALALLRRLDADAVNAGYARLGLPHSHYYTDWRPDTTTAAETASLLALIAGGQAVGGVATRHMLELMAQDQPQAWIREALPPGTPVAHKSGQLPGVRNDAAIVYGPDGPYVIVVLAEDLSDEADGESIIGTIAGEVHAYFVALDKGKPLLVLP